MTARRKEAWTALLFVSPWIVGFSTFLLYPLLASVYYSFCDYSVLHSPVWVGTANYTTLYHDEVFWKTLGNTLIYTLMALPMSMIVALSLAMMLNAKVRGMTIYRTIFFVPSLVPAASLAILWLWIFNGQQGVVNGVLQPLLDATNGLLHLLHIPAALSAPQWLSSPVWSKPALVLMGVWGSGNAMLIYLAGLQDVPQALYEAADLDGAGWWAKTWHVTLPMLSPVILFNLIMGIIGTLQVFTVPYIMFPGGSPERSTYFYTMYLYDNAFVYLKMGYACAMGWIMFLIILVLTLVALRMSERRVYYGGS
ncbi:MAG TPA: sugar ABC transporter permease [Chthonomonadaceae bacterium]|nr:sugar ABC transporter permease [Chthonomonadaceae bacterium]